MVDIPVYAAEAALSSGLSSATASPSVRISWACGFSPSGQVPLYNRSRRATVMAATRANRWLV